VLAFHIWNVGVPYFGQFRRREILVLKRDVFVLLILWIDHLVEECSLDISFTNISGKVH
jgi:hypothetical protein